MVQLDQPMAQRVSLGARKGQRIAAMVLLAVTSVSILGALYAPFFPLAMPGWIEETFGIRSAVSPVITAAAVVQWVMLVVSVGLTVWFLSKRWVAFYIPLAAGVVAGTVFWIVYFGRFVFV